MNEKNFNKTFSKNLNYFLDINNKSQLDLAKYVNVTPASVSNWCKGIKVPRMDKVDIICDFFKIQRSELMEDDGPSQQKKRVNEKELLHHYNILNDLGKRKVIEYASDLSNNIQYCKSELNAAHEIVGASEEDKKHDDNIMNNDIF